MSQEKNIPYEQLQSDTIKLVRFPLIVGVVMLHMSLETVILGGELVFNIADFPAYDYYKFFFDKVLAVRIPLYFFISGYLFFNRADHFTKADYFKKIRRRVDTLAVPYVSWILIGILMYGLQQYFLGDLSSGGRIPISQWGVCDVFRAFWSEPILAHLWFLRDLFSLMILSPIIYVLIKYLKIIPVLVFTVLWIGFETVDIAGISLCGLAFFGFGAYFSITKRNFVRTFAPYSWWIYGLFTLLAIALFIFKGSLIEPYFNRFITPVGSICVVLICSHLLYKKVCRPSDTLANASFFIYVFHLLPDVFLCKLALIFVPVNSSMTLIGIHVVCTIIVVGSGLLCYLFIRKYSPLLLKLLSGGR